jgi:cytochrome P450
MPPIVLAFQGVESVLAIHDPEVVNEIYVTKNKFVDKADKLSRILRSVCGDSILFSPSDEKWAQKRKHLSAAFYKDKINEMLGTIIRITNQQVQVWKRENAETREPLDIISAVSKLIMECILQCIFGLSSI